MNAMDESNKSNTYIIDNITARSIGNRRYDKLSSSVCLDHEDGDGTSSSSSRASSHNTMLCESTDRNSNLTSSSRSTIRKRLRGSVSFSVVEFREYEVVLGDNPSCSSGPPLSLGWKYNNENQHEISIEDYEDHRLNHRRTRNEMKIPSYLRYEILKEWNVSRKEIADARKELREIQIRRFKIMKAVNRRVRLNERLNKTFRFALCRCHAISLLPVQALENNNQRVVTVINTVSDPSEQCMSRALAA